MQTVVEHFDSNPSCPSSVTKKVAFLSTPSVYFSLPHKYLQHCTLFDIDPMLGKAVQRLKLEKMDGNPQFIAYDFNVPLGGVDEQLLGTYTMFVVDPPFITRDVWEKYTETINALRNEQHCQILCSTIAENEGMMKQLLDISPVTFRPFIPNLVYLYKFYTNFDSSTLGQENTEIVFE